MVAEEFVEDGYRGIWIHGYKRTWNKIVTEELEYDIRSKLLQRKLQT